MVSIISYTPTGKINYKTTTDISDEVPENTDKELFMVCDSGLSVAGMCVVDDEIVPLRDRPNGNWVETNAIADGETVLRVENVFGGSRVFVDCMFGKVAFIEATEDYLDLTFTEKGRYTLTATTDTYKDLTVIINAG